MNRYGLTQQPQNVSDRWRSLGKSQVLATFLDPINLDGTKLRQLIDPLETERSAKL